MRRIDGFQKDRIRITTKIRNARSNAHICINQIIIRKVILSLLDLNANKIEYVHGTGRTVEETLEFVFDAIHNTGNKWEHKYSIEPNSEACHAYELKFSDSKPLGAFKGAYSIVFEFTRGDNKSGKIRKTFLIDDKAIR